MARPILRLLLVSTTVGADVFAQLMDGASEAVTVDAVDTVAGAVDLLSVERFDVTVLDLSVPDCDGVAGVRAIQIADPAAALVVMGPASHDDLLLGAISLGVEGHLDADHLQAAVTQHAVRYALARKRAETERVRRALTDPLTGLQNRLALEEFLPVALLRAERRGTRIGLVFVDIDSADEVHDVHGRSAWDEVMVEVARRLREVARESDSVARLTGGTFVVVCEDLRLEASVRRLSDRIHAVLEPHLRLPDGTLVQLSVTLGFTAGDGSTEPAELLRRAGHRSVLQTGADRS